MNSVINQQVQEEDIAMHTIAVLERQLTKMKIKVHDGDQTCFQKCQ